MALCRVIHCSACDQDKEVWFDPNDPIPKICAQCHGKSAEEAKKATLAAWAAQSTEERLKRLEEVAYNFGLR